MVYDAVIIGGGLSGLECACILSKQGMNVVVLECGRQAGGCLQSYSRGEMSYDTGFHCVGGIADGQSLHGAFRALGLLDLPWQRMDADGFDRVTIAGRTFAYHEGFAGFAQRLAEDFPSQRSALYRYADLLKATTERQYDALKCDPNLTAMPIWLADVNAYDYLQEMFSEPLLIDALSGSSLKMELRRESLPLFEFAHINSCFIESSWRLRGDGSMIANRLVEELTSCGGSMVTGAEVVRLERSGGRLTAAVCANGQAYEGKLFVSSIHPASTIRLVADSSMVRRSFMRRIAMLENTTGMFTASLRLKPKTLRYFNHNHYVYRKPGVWELLDANAPLECVMVSCRVPTDGSEYADQIDLLTPMSWDICKPWAGTRPGRRGTEYEAMKQQWADGCIALAEQVVPELGSMVAECHTSTPLTYHDYTLIPEGSAYGVRKDCRSPLTTILSPQTPIGNLFLTGQNTMRHGLYGTTMSVLATCALIIGCETVLRMVEE